MRKPLQTFSAVTAANPGFHAVAGPYDVNSTSHIDSTKSRAQCVRSFRDQKRACLKARIVFHHGKAWIIRKKPLELDNGKRNKENVAGSFGICAGRMAGL